MSDQPAGGQGTHFWIMTLMASTTPGSFSTSHSSGTITPAVGATRYSLFESLLATVREQRPEMRDSVVLGFDIQPNEINAPRSNRWWRR